MNFARVAAAAVVAWMVSLGVGYLVNEVLFKDLFMSGSFLRPEAEINGLLPLGFAFLLVGFFAFAYMYAKGYEGGNGAMEGLRFGVLVAVMIDCFSVIWNYVMLPESITMLTATMLDYIVEFSIYGAIVGAIYRPTQSPATTPSVRV
jgi:hypothetical protein